METMIENEFQLQVNIKDKHFGDCPIIEDFTLNVMEGESVSVLGSNGIGKSTVFKIIAGLDSDYDGEVVFDKRRIHDPVKDISMMFQGHRLLPWLSVRDNIKFINNDIRDEDICSYLRRVGIVNKEHSWPNRLSGGEKTRVALSVALINKSKLLLLDEPFSDVDVKMKIGVIDLLKSIRKIYNTTLLSTTHNIDDALSLSERIIVLGGTPATTVFDSNVNAANNGNLKEELKEILIGS